MEKDAVISECGTYRYSLTRKWSEGPTCVFIMLNPSTADASEDDPTIRRCIGFAKREGCGSLEVVNLMAFRATNPKDIPSDADTAMGPDNFKYIKSAINFGNPIIAAWGSHPAGKRLGVDMLRVLKNIGADVKAFKLTKSGVPGHPLYIKSDAPLVEITKRAD